MRIEDFIRLFSKKLKIFQINLSSIQEEKFYNYLELLNIWNRKMNLTAIEGEEDIILKHFVDSLTCSIAIKNESITRVIDIGTGAGFPGIPLKIYYESWKLTLLEAQKKKIRFLEEVVEKLELRDVEIIWNRAENLARNENYREKFDLVLARGVAKPNIVLEYAIPFVNINKIFLAQTGKKSIEEWRKANKILEILGAKWEKEFDVSFDDIKRILIVFRKIFSTSEKYPRKPGIPEKRPLNIN